MERRLAYFLSGSSEWEYRIKWKGSQHYFAPTLHLRLCLGYVEETWEPIANIAVIIFFSQTLKIGRNDT